MLPAGVSPLGGLNVYEGRPVHILWVDVAPQGVIPSMSEGMSAECRATDAFQACCRAPIFRTQFSQKRVLLGQ